MFILGVVFVAALVLAPVVLANLDRVSPGIPVWVYDNNFWYYPTLIGQDINTTLSCIEPDGGFNPLLRSDMNVTFSDKNGMVSYRDHCLDANTLVEFACGSNFMGWPNWSNSNSSFAFTFNCGDLNKSCSAGRCV